MLRLLHTSNMSVSKAHSSALATEAAIESRRTAHASSIEVAIHARKRANLCTGSQILVASQGATLWLSMGGESRLMEGCPNTWSGSEAIADLRSHIVGNRRCHVWLSLVRRGTVVIVIVHRLGRRPKVRFRGVIAPTVRGVVVLLVAPGSGRGLLMLLTAVGVGSASMRSHWRAMVTKLVDKSKSPNVKPAIHRHQSPVVKEQIYSLIVRFRAYCREMKVSRNRERKKES